MSNTTDTHAATVTLPADDQIHMHIDAGMEGGMNESFDALEQVARALG
jgi:hypothetical protein